MYLASLLFWLATLQGVRHAHWAVYFGWLFLSLYLAFYFPIFIALSRRAIERWKVWPLVAIPAIWSGLELARSYLLTGFPVALLAHTQVAQINLLQISDLFGAYGLSFAIILVGTLVGQSPSSPFRFSHYVQRWQGPLAALLVIGAMLSYGTLRRQSLEQNRLTQEGSPPQTTTVLLMGRQYYTRFDAPLEEKQKTIEAYLEQTVQLLQKNPHVDLVVWPESVLTLNVPYSTAHPQSKASKEWNFPPFLGQFPHLQRIFKPLVVGANHFHFDKNEQPILTNSAITLDENTNPVNIYDKMHPVMFGEYIPLGDYFPFLYDLAPISLGLTPGPKPTSFEHEGVNFIPNICFEITIPHLVRKQAIVCNDPQSMNVILNISNDGWFWGSSIADLHFNCSVFRAVELRTPVLMAANAGYCGFIDSTGELVDRNHSFNDEAVLATIPHASPHLGTLYLWVGDWPIAVCLLFCLMLGGDSIVGTVAKKFQRKPSPRRLHKL